MSRHSRLAAIIWDLDGTLVDSAPDIAASLNTLLQRYNRPPLNANSVRRMIGNGVARLIERGFAESGSKVRKDDIQSLLPEFMSIYTERATQLTRPYPGVVSALQAFKDAGVSQAICTNKPEAVSREILRDLDLNTYFDIVVGGDTFEYRKPHPLPLQTCLNTLGSDVDRSVMIGDSGVDVATARAVGMTVGIVTHGYSRQPVETLGADFLVTDLAMLPTYIYEQQYLARVAS